MNLWSLPRFLTLEGERYDIRWGWQDVMAVLAELNADRPEWVCWFRAVARFFVQPVPDALLSAAASALADFITAGRRQKQGLKLLDWELDAMEIVADINRVAGREVRDENVHWWTFLGWFHAIGEGRLSELVTLRSKLARGEKLTAAEEAFYRENRDRIRLRRPSDEEAAWKERLK